MTDTKRFSSTTSPVDLSMAVKESAAQAGHEVRDEAVDAAGTVKDQAQS